MEKLEAFVREGWGLLAPYPLAQAALIVVFFLLMAKLVDRACTGIATRMVTRTETTLDNQLVEILHRPVFTTVALMGLILAAYRVGLPDQLEKVTIAVIQSLLIFVWLVFGLRFSRLVIDALSREKRRFKFVQSSTRPLLNNALAVLLVLAGAYSILLAWEINVTGLVASAGIIGLALSFAAQDTLANLFAGVAILADRPYRLGDYIILDTGERGEVTAIGLRSTRLLTRDDVEVTIPNGVMGKAKIVNEAGGPQERYRVRLPIGVAYGSDIDKVMEVLLSVANEHPKIVPTPVARVRFRNFGDSSLDFELLCWIAQPADRGLVTHELNCAIYKAFADAGIQIPFPQRDLHVKEMPG